ncbi:hypothetical protein DPMN_181006 [Dreissena polymorpha]|uniref:Uncharacterized protein n=1 Tax=Dreissena polymorpha TaxID=45954 RepID=A0A9D4DBI4_DREPO|nr:hypothetical protein DPMN_181006 [Dreissena polymorpha]
MLAASLSQACGKLAKEACASLELEPRSKLARACASLLLILVLQACDSLSLRKLRIGTSQQACASLHKLVQAC